MDSAGGAEAEAEAEAEARAEEAVIVLYIWGFADWGGKRLQSVPCLNGRDSKCLCGLISRRTYVSGARQQKFNRRSGKRKEGWRTLGVAETPNPRLVLPPMNRT